MDYIVKNKEYVISYQELKENYLEYKRMKDKDFMKNIPEILHTACVICYLKELHSSNVLSDEGIIHQLVHLLTIPDEPSIDLKEIRKLFNQQCELV